jgi:hypothetical protein
MSGIEKIRSGLTSFSKSVEGREILRPEKKRKDKINLRIFLVLISDSSRYLWSKNAEQFPTVIFIYNVDLSNKRNACHSLMHGRDPRRPLACQKRSFGNADMSAIERRLSLFGFAMLINGRFGSINGRFGYINGRVKILTVVLVG